ncbi:MAG: SLC13/DASS family transporter [Gammaproteobacteria bacterium TMED182]|nr:sodium:dicarboxylate symporter [Gammaproteobacteria bacterium]RPG48852.1 MAG: SLC13/DASS family transporter [Gammaproteobacteria bacterium TMED182]
MIRPIHITTALGPALALLVFWLLNTPEQDSAIAFTAAITIWTAVWWIFEPIPIPATSLLPLALFPAVGVLTPTEVGAAYGSPLVLLLMGGFILSTAMERSGAHRRVALTMVNLFGGSSSKRLVFGFMAAAALLSMWISNTATTLMLLPVAMAVLEKAPDKKLAIPLLLGIAYASSIGGIGTPIGTPPNLVFQQVYTETLGSEIGFLTWMSWGVPVVLIFVPITALWLTRGLDYQGSFILPAVGTWQSAERRVLIVFALTALAWVTRSQPFGGWSTFLNVPGINDAGVAMLAVVVMFLVPDGRGERLLNWESAAKIPWGMLILFGGGIAIAKAFVASGLSQQLGIWLTQLATLDLFLLILAICLTITFMTEITSNTATTTLMLPILAAAALAAEIPPEILMVPAAMSASCAFMLPVATAPNTIMFSTGAFPIRTMVKEGLALNLIGALLITSACRLLI